MAAFENQRPSKVSLPFLGSRGDGQGASDKERNPSAKNVLVLDLDETLVESKFIEERAPFTVLRPGLVEFLREVNQLFEVVYWTAGTEPYGRAVLSAIERGGEALDGKPVNGPHPTALFRQHTDEDRNWMKSLYRLGRPVQQCFLLDDARRSFPFTPRQALLAEEFFIPYASIPKKYKGKKGVVGVVNLKEDTFLERILPMLRALAKATSSPAAATREMDHWRPEGYHELDTVREDRAWDAEPKLGDFTPQRNSKPIRRLSEKFYTKYAKKGKILSDSHVSHNEEIERHERDYPAVWASVTLPDKHEELLDLTGRIESGLLVSSLAGELFEKYGDTIIGSMKIYPPGTTKPSHGKDDIRLLGHEDLELLGTEDLQQSSKEKPYQVVIEPWESSEKE